MRPALTLTVVALCLVLAAPSAPAVAAAAAPAPTSAADRAAARAIDAYTQPLVARGDLSGQLLVLRDGRVVAERSYGYANAELRAPVTPETRFNIASVTKPMTAVIAIHLIEAGTLGVSDTIARWLPDFPKADSIRVEHLLRHRSGIPHETIPDSERTHPFTSAEVVARAARLPLDFSPGSRGNYSSGGYEVLARVLELASGRTYQQLLEQHLFGPLGMTHTTDADSRRLMPGRAQGYVPGVHGLQNAPLEDFSALIGAGSVWSTARDLHRFVVAVVAGKLGAGPQQSFVRGGHLDFNGRTGGFKAWALWDSTSGVEAIFLGNLAGGASDALKRDIVRLASGQVVRNSGAARLARRAAHGRGDAVLGRHLPDPRRPAAAAARARRRALLERLAAAADARRRAVLASRLRDHPRRGGRRREARAHRLDAGQRDVRGAARGGVNSAEAREAGEEADAHMYARA